MSDNLYDSSYILEIQELNTAEAAAAAALAASDNSTPQVWQSGEVITVDGSSGSGGSGGAAADVRSSGTINSASLNATYGVAINAQGTASFVVTGLTASGATLTVEASDNVGVSWSAVNGIAPSTGILFNTINTDSQFRVNAGGRTNLRLRVSTVGTGTITVVSNVSAVSSVVALSSPLPSGSNNIGNVGIVGSIPITAATDLSTTGTITALNTGVALTINGVSGALINVTGIWSGTIQFQGLTPDGSTWVPLWAVTGGPTNAYSVTGITANANARLMTISGFKQIRAYSTAWTSGTATVNIDASAGTAVSEVVQLNQANLAVNINSLDNTVLYNGTVSASGALTGIDTTGYQSIVVEVQGSGWNGIIEVETNTDNSVPWYNLQVINTDRSGLAEFIASNGVFVSSVTGRYIRINVLEMSGTATITVLGRTVQAMSAIDLLSQALDPKNGVQLQVVETSLKRDQSNALVLSDNPAPISIVGLVGTVIKIDTTGYQSVNITSLSFAGSVTASDDDLTYQAVTGVPRVLGLMTATIAAGAGYSFPVLGRWMKITLTTAGSGVAYLKNTPFNPLYTTTPQVAGGAGVNAGVVGIPAVGGNIAVGVAPTANPIIAGSIDTSGLTRRILSDITGKIIPASFDATGKPITYTYDQTGTNRILNSLSPAYSSENVSTLPVSDQTLFEGQNFVELLGMILLELRVQNQLLHQIGMGNAIVDEPNVMRQDQTLYAI